jgi:hypothetical protein
VTAAINYSPKRSNSLAALPLRRVSGPRSTAGTALTETSFIGAGDPRQCNASFPSRTRGERLRCNLAIFATDTFPERRRPRNGGGGPELEVRAEERLEAGLHAQIAEWVGAEQTNQRFRDDPASDRSKVQACGGDFALGENVVPQRRAPGEANSRADARSWSGAIRWGSNTGIANRAAQR